MPAAESLELCHHFCLSLLPEKDILELSFTKLGFYSARSIIKPWRGSILKAQQNWVWVALTLLQENSWSPSTKIQEENALANSESNTRTNSWSTTDSCPVWHWKSEKTTISYSLLHSRAKHTSWSLHTRCSQGPWAVQTLPKICKELSFPVLQKVESWLQRAYKSNSCQREATRQMTDMNEMKSSTQVCGIPGKS